MPIREDDPEARKINGYAANATKPNKEKTSSDDRMRFDCCPGRQKALMLTRRRFPSRKS